MSLLTVLPPYSTVEQALLGSALKLRTSCLKRVASAPANALDDDDDAPIDDTADDTADDAIVELSRIADAFKIVPVMTPSNTGEIVSFVMIEAKLYYNSSDALDLGFDVFDCLIPFTDDSINRYPECIAIQGNYQAYPQIPIQVKTLEQYFLYNVYLLASSTYPANYIDYKTYDVPDLTSQTIPNVTIVVSLPFDYKRFCITRSPINSLTKLCNSYVLPSFDGSVPILFSSAINNTFPVNNILAFKN